jgi:hypothetical protein
VPLSCNLGTLTSCNPLDHSRPVTGLLYLFFNILARKNSRVHLTAVLHSGRKLEGVNRKGFLLNAYSRTGVVLIPETPELLIEVHAEKRVVCAFGTLAPCVQEGMSFKTPV